MINTQSYIIASQARYAHNLGATNTLDNKLTAVQRAKALVVSIFAGLAYVFTAFQAKLHGIAAKEAWNQLKTGHRFEIGKELAAQKKESDKIGSDVKAMQKAQIKAKRAARKLIERTQDEKALQAKNAARKVELEAARARARVYSEETAARWRGFIARDPFFASRLDTKGSDVGQSTTVSVESAEELSDQLSLTHVGNSSIFEAEAEKPVEVVDILVAVKPKPTREELLAKLKRAIAEKKEEPSRRVNADRTKGAASLGKVHKQMGAMRYKHTGFHKAYR